MKQNKIERFLVLEANAGSGKTFSLVVRFISLLFLDVEPEKIFALTFTRKATKEMFDRILQSLQNPKNSSEIKFIQSEMELSDDEVLELSKKSLEKLLNSEIKISTIDSFALNILKRFSHYLNIIPQFQIVEKLNEERFKEFFFRALNQEKYRQELVNLEKLNSKLTIDEVFDEMQFFYVKELEIYEFYKKYLNYQPPTELYTLENIIMETANALADWFSYFDLSSRGKNALTFSDFHEFLEKSKTWITKNKLSEYSYFKKAFKENGESDLLNSTFQKLKELLTTYFEIREKLIFKSLFKIFQLYIIKREEFVKREHKFAFEDINHFLVQIILNPKIDSQFIYFRLDSKIEHLLIDEFQDTSLFQYKILSPIIEDILAGSGDIEKTFFYVGDKKQSLYRFRGGFSSLFDHILKKYSNIKHEKLTKNYRSKENIINFVNEVFGTSQIAGTEHQKGGIVKFYETDNPFKEIINEIEDLIEKNIPLNEITVLCATNNIASEVEAQIFAKNFKTKLESNEQVLQHHAVRAIVSYMLYLYFLDDPNSDFYLKEFQIAMGYSPTENLENKLFFNIFDFSPYQSAVKILKHYELFDGDENTILFLENLNHKYSDINDFAFTYQLYLDKLVKTQDDGINIMTIHKSKGLEFSHVILLDFSSKTGISNKAQYTSIIYNGIEPQDIIWKKGSDYSERFEFAKDVERKNRQNDHWNLIYVACTRAKNSLTIIKSKKNSAFEILKFNEINYSKYQDFTENTFQKPIIQETTPKRNLDFVEKFYGYQIENFSKENISSDVFEDDFVDEVETENKIDLKHELENSRNMDFGTALHSVLEMLDDFNLNNLETLLTSIQNRFSSLSQEAINNIQTRIINLINNSLFQKMISSDGNEKPIIKKESGYFYNGELFFIDLLIEKKDEIIVIDFKSSNNSLFEEKYHKQVLNYVEIVKSIYKKETHGYLIFLLRNGVEIKKVQEKT